MFSRYFGKPSVQIAFTSGGRDFDVAQVLDYVDASREYGRLARPGAEGRQAFLARLADLNRRLRRYGQALADVRAALALADEPDDGDAAPQATDLRYLEGKILLRLARFREAAALFRAVSADPACGDELHWRAQLQLGRVLARQGRDAAAIETLREVIAHPIAPHNLFQGRLDLIHAHLRSGELDEAEAVCTDARPGADADEDAAPSIWRYYHAWLLVSRRRLRDGIGELTRARDEFERLQFNNGVGIAELSLAQALFEACDFDACQEAVLRSLSAASAAGSGVTRSAGLITSGYAYFVAGQPEQALRQFLHARHIAERAEAVDWTCRAIEGRSDVQSFHGDFDDATAEIEVSLALRNRIGDRTGECWDENNLGNVLKQRGDFEGAWRHYDRAEAVARDLGDTHLVAASQANRGEALLAAGRLDEAESHLEQSVATLSGREPGVLLARTLKHHAQLCSIRDDWTRAFELFDRALEAQRGDENPIVVAEILISKALSHHDKNENERANELLEHAAETLGPVVCPPLQERVRHLRREIRQRSHAKVVLSRYLDHRVVDRLMARPERRLAINVHQEVTVLFSDIRSYSTLSENLSAQDVVRLLNEHFEGMTEVINAHGGIIDKFIGDAVMAVFGAPGSPAAHDAADAVRAAVEMIARRAELDEQRTARGEAPVRIGVGLYTGPVVMGHIGSSTHTNYTVIGDTVNVAARLEALTKEYRVPVLLGDTTHERLGGEIPCRRVDEMTVRGRQQATVLYTPE